MKRDLINLFDLPFPEHHRWIPGDQYLRVPVRKLLRPFRGTGPSGLGKVTQNLTLGLDRLKVPYHLHRLMPSPPTHQDQVLGLLHGPLETIQQIARSNPCIVGPGVFGSPEQWPDLFTGSRAILRIENCEWAADLYRPLYGTERVAIWAMGVDENRFAPTNTRKKYDFLIYDKIRWPDNPAYKDLLATCMRTLDAMGCTSTMIRYGQYPRGKETAYHDMLGECRALLYLSEHETQGFAYNEALSMGTPILAWNFGHWCDPIQFTYGHTGVAATSIPYWDERCGLSFQGTEDFAETAGMFFEQLNSNRFSPREFVLENLRLDQGAQRYLDLLQTAREMIDQ